MLFLAVFCGFLAENLRELNLEKNRARKYAILLKKDLVNDTTVFNTFIDTGDSLKKVNAEFIVKYETPEEKMTLGDLLFLDTHFTNGSTFDPHDVTYTELISSGNLRLFENPEISVKLAGYQKLVKYYIEYFKNNFDGGVGVDYSLKYDIHRKDFLKKYGNSNKEMLIKDAGYNFEGWRETATLSERYIKSIDLFNTEVYRDWKKSAIEIILLLNKEYHLK